MSHSSCSHVSDVDVAGVVDLEPLLQIMSLDAGLGLEDRQWDCTEGRMGIPLLLIYFLNLHARVDIVENMSASAI